MSKEIKATAVAGLLAAALCAGGCAPVVAEAPFPARPDGAEAGDLLGPFTGRVIDAATSKPLSGAVVFASWGFDTGRGLVSPSGGDSLSVETDSDGRYQVPRLPHVPRGRDRVARFTLVVYKPGYLAWRSDRRFDDHSARRDFAQWNAVAKLDRWSSGMSHVKHLRFAGGAGAIKRAMAGELVQASLELSGQTAAPVEDGGSGGGPLLDVTALLSADELRAVTGYAGAFEAGRLGDLPQASHYDSRHFKAVGKPESYDAAIRVWRAATPQGAWQRWEKVVKEVPNSEIKDELGDKSLRGHDGKILAVAAIDKARRLVIQLTCGIDQCRDHAQAVALLKRILARADKLGAAPAAAEEKKVEPPKEEEKKPEGQAEQKPEEKPEEKKEEKKEESKPLPAVEENQFKLREPGLKR
jgi:hypothetical protein